MKTVAQELIKLGNAINEAVETKTMLRYDDAKLLIKYRFRFLLSKSSLDEPDKWWTKMWETSEFKSILPEHPDEYYSTHK